MILKALIYLGHKSSELTNALLSRRYKRVVIICVCKELDTEIAYEELTRAVHQMTA